MRATDGAYVRLRSRSALRARAENVCCRAVAMQSDAIRVGGKAASGCMGANMSDVFEHINTWFMNQLHDDVDLSDTMEGLGSVCWRAASRFAGS